MSATALTLVLVSVCLHAGWNVLGKSRVPSLTFFALATAAGGLALAPLLWLGPPLGELPWRFWSWLAATGLCQTLYLGGLAWAYARGEMSVLYPLARALPVLVVPLVTVGLLGSRVLVAGLMIQATYGLVLVALAMTEEVSYVVAMRQLSIPLGVLIGIMWLRERATHFKLLGTGIIVLGLWLVAYQ